MSGGGGDTGGGDSGGSSKGGGGAGGGGGFDSGAGENGADSNGFNATFNPGNAGAGDTTSSFAPDPSTNGGGSLDQFISDPSGGNLSGPGPVGNEAGQPGMGGGTNQPFSGNDFSFNSPLDGISADSFSGPVASGGVSSTGDSLGGAAAVNPAAGGFDSLVSASNNPGGTSAAGTSAPAGVSGNTDISSNSSLSTAKPTNTGSSGGSSDNSGILSSLGLGKGNTAGALVGAAGLLNNLVTGNKAPAGSAPLSANAAGANATAAQQTTAGQALQQWQTTGTLPDSYESGVQRAAQDAKTRAISNAAAQGLPTDPTQNTALAQQLNAIDAALPGQREAIAAQLAQSGTQMVQAGLQATGISSGIYQSLATMDQAQQNARGAAIANFATALNGGGNRGLTLKVA